MARGPPRTNARHINIAVADHVGYPSTSFEGSLMYLETRQIQRGSGARRGARGASTASAANALHDLRIDLAPS